MVFGAAVVHIGAVPAVLGNGEAAGLDLDGGRAWSVDVLIEHWPAVYRQAAADAFAAVASIAVAKRHLHQNRPGPESQVNRAAGGIVAGIGSCADLGLLPFQPLRLGLGGPHACVDPGKVLIEVRPQKAVGRLPLVQLIVFRIICHIFYISSLRRDTPLSAARPNPDSLQPCLEIPSTKCLPPEALKPFWFQGLSPFSLSGLSTKCLPSKPFHAVTEFFR